MYIGAKISSSRLDRVQEAAKQLRANKAAAVAVANVIEGTTAAAAAGVAISVQIVRPVIEIGSDLAFAMEQNHELTLWFGRVEIMHGRN